MGNCPPQKEQEPGSIIRLSESCVERLTREEKESGKKTAAEELHIPQDVSEKDWMIKLKCLDDSHSNTYGLTVQAFYKLADQVEGQMEPIRIAECSNDEIIRCLKRNPCCMIKCKPVMDKYIDCVDTVRVNIIKEKIENELREKRKEDQEIVEDFLKNGNENNTTEQP